MQNKPLNIVITGGNSGIGFQTMKNLYLSKNNLIFGSRNQIKNSKAIQLILQQSSQVSSQAYKTVIKSFPLDLSNKISIQIFAKFIQDSFDHVDILINNAGIAMNQLKRNQQNVQMTLAVSYFGHFYLTYLLFDLLKKSEKARIINLGSDSHYRAPKNPLGDIECQKKSYSMFQQTFISKFMMVAFTHEFGNRLHKKYSNVKTVCLNPGAVSTNFDQGICLLKIVKILCCCMFVSQQKGSQCPVYLCKVRFEDLVNRQYYDKNKKMKQMDERAKDEKLGRQLWEISEKVYNIKFNI